MDPNPDWQTLSVRSWEAIILWCHVFFLKFLHFIFPPMKVKCCHNNNENNNKIYFWIIVFPSKTSVFTDVCMSVCNHKGMLWWSDFIYLPIPRPWAHMRCFSCKAGLCTVRLKLVLELCVMWCNMALVNVLLHVMLLGNFVSPPSKSRVVRILRKREWKGLHH